MMTKLNQAGRYSHGRTSLNFGCLLALLLSTACSDSQPPRSSVASKPGPKLATSPVVPPGQPQYHETILLDNDSLEGWEVSNFGGEGECTVENGELVVEMGYPLSGVTSTRDNLPTRDYEISLEAKRTQGIDFFCGLTFPVNDSHCTLIVGGWAGAVVGLSCVDEQDASRNETKTLMKFEDDRWYKIRVKVGDAIEAWIDDKQVVELATEGHKFSLRAETLVSRPLGICTFDTSAKFREIVIREYSSESGSDNQE